MAYPPRVLFRCRWSGAALLAFALWAGCDETVVLGGECSPLGSACQRDSAASDMDAGPRPQVDAALDAGAAEDAAPTVDAEPPPPDATFPPVEGGTGLLGPFPPIQNGSFEITAGPAGGGTLGALSGTKIDPWQSCAGSIEVKASDGMLTPSQGASFLKLSFGAGPGTLVQQMSPELAKDGAYAIAVDVASSAGASGVVLRVAGSSASCFQGETLAETPAIEAGQPFRTYCLTFKPKASYSHLMLQLPPTASTGALYVDNLREATGCP